MIDMLGWMIPGSMVAVALLVWGTLVYGARRAEIGAAPRRRFVLASGAVILGWLGAAMALAAAGFVKAAPDRVLPGVLLPLTVPLAAGALAIRNSRILGAVLDAIPLPWLAGMQLYRVFGFTFLALYFAGHLPGEFAIPAGAGDVAVGLAAPVVAWLFLARAQGSGLAMLGWNLAGILDLIVAVAAGFLTSPGPLQAFALDAPNELITAWPLALVPAFAVPLSVLLHLVVLRRLKSEMETPADENPSPARRAGEGWVSRLMAI